MLIIRFYKLCLVTVLVFWLVRLVVLKRAKRRRYRSDLTFKSSLRQKSKSYHYACQPASIQGYRKLLLKANVLKKKDKKSNILLNSNVCNCFELIQVKGRKYVTCLPTYFIIGQAKSGTSSLYNYLLKHPNFIAAKVKETYRPQFPLIDYMKNDIGPLRSIVRFRRYVLQFSHLGKLDCNLYRSSTSTSTLFGNQSSCSIKLPASNITDEFSLLSLTVTWSEILDLKNSNKSTEVESYYKLAMNKRGTGPYGNMFMIGEGTPDYHQYADIPHSLHEYFPTARIILIARDPIERAISSYSYTGLGGAIDPLGVNITHFLGTVKEHYDRSRLCDTEDLGGTLQTWTDTMNNPVLNPPILHPKGHPIHTKYLELRNRVNNVTQGKACSFQPFVNQHNNYFVRVSFYDQLKWWLKYYPANQIAVVDFASLKSDPELTTLRVLSFLGAVKSNIVNDKATNDSIGLSYATSYHRYNGPFHTILDENVAAANVINKQYYSKNPLKSLLLNEPHFRRFNITVNMLNEIKEIKKFFKEFDYKKQLQQVESLNIHVVKT